MNTDMWNVHNVHIYNIGIPKHKTLPISLFRYETFYYLWVKRFFDIRKEIHLTFPSAPNHVRTRRKATASQRKSTFFFRPQNSTLFFKSPKILRARFWCMTSFTYPSHTFYLGFLFWHIWMTHPSRARVNTCARLH